MLSPELQITRLTPRDIALAKRTFAVMGAVFEEPSEELPDAWLTPLLARDDFLAFAALVDGEVVGGLTAHVLPLTRRPVHELFLYDLAVMPEHQRRGIGRALVEAARAAAKGMGIDVVWVPADVEDAHALDFYRALGGAEAPVAIFTFGGR